MKSKIVLTAFALAVAFSAYNASAETEEAERNGYYTCYAQTPDGTRYSASGYGSPDRIQQEALNRCVEIAHYNCRRAGCE